MALVINFSEKEKIFQRWKKDYDEFRFKGFKHYWVDSSKPIHLYRDRNYSFWKDNAENRKVLIKAYEKGLKNLYDYYQMLKKEI